MLTRQTRTPWPALLLAAAASCPIAVFHAPRVLAQDTTSGAGGQLRLGEVFGLLETASPRLQAARQSALAAEERIAPARTLPDPQLQFGLMNRSLPGFGLQRPLGMNQVQLMQMLPIAGKLGLAGQVARAQAEGARARAADLGWELRARAAMAFYELYQIDQSLGVALETQRLLQDIAKTAETMYGVGSGRQADVLRAQVEVARMGEDILRMRAMRDAAGARLNALLDRPQDVRFATPAIPVFPADLPSLDSLERLALGNRPMIQAGRRDVEAAAAQARLARREIWPDLQVGVQYGQQPMAEGGTDRMMSFMLGFSLPIFAGGRQLPMRREAAAMRLMAEADLDAMRAETRGRLGELYADVGRARRLSVLYRGTIIPQAEATVASALAAYRVASVDFMTLLDDQMTVNRYRQALYQLQAEHGQALAEIEMLVGQELLDANTVELPTGGNK